MSINTASGKLMNRAAWAAISVAAMLAGVKAVAWWMSGSVALLGSLFDSVLDVAASLINFIAIRTALEPADKEHRFGHGKAEAIAGLFQAAIITGSAVFLGLESADRLVNPAPVAAIGIGIGVSIFAILATLALVFYQRHVIRATGSLAVSADQMHYKGDIALNLAVIAAFVLSGNLGIISADGVLGLLIAAYLAFAAWKIGRQSVDMLMDHEFTDDEREHIIELALGNEEVKGIHDLKTRRSGIQSFIQMHLELDPKLNLHTAHAISDEVEATVGEVFQNAEIIIHIDPLGVEGHQLTEKEVG